MMFWPDTRFDGLATDAKIADPTAYGIPPGPAGFSIADLRCTPTAVRHPRGIYTETAIALVLSGTFEYASEGCAGMAVPGSLVFGNKGAEFSCRHEGTEGNRRIVVFFSEELLAPLASAFCLDAPRFQATSSPPSRATTQVAGLLLKIARGTVDGIETAMEIAHICLCASAGARSNHASEADRRGVLEAVRYINARFTEPCPLDTLAAVAGMNRFRFAKQFRAVTGETANQYVINRRLSAAATRLAESKAAIAEIAYDVGFNDISHFDACFRSAFGCPPSVWRRNC